MKNILPLMLALCLVACGQKGPLFVPGDQPAGEHGAHGRNPLDIGHSDRHSDSNDNPPIDQSAVPQPRHTVPAGASEPSTTGPSGY